MEPSEPEASHEAIQGDQRIRFGSPAFQVAKLWNGYGKNENT